MKLLDILDATPFPIGYRIAFLTNFWREPVLRQMERDFGIIRPELTVLMCLSFQRNVHARDICEITEQPSNCLLYTSDAADDMQCLKLACRLILKKKK